MHPKKTRNRIAAAAIAALTIGALAGCGSDAPAPGGNGDGTGNGDGATGTSSLLEELREEGTITMAIADERPYSWVENGQPLGATVAMHEQIFAGLGIDNVEVVQVDWNALIPGLKAGRFDAISAGMSILPERCAEASFSDPEIMYTTTLMVADGNPEGLTDLDSVVAKDGSVTLAVLAGGIEAGYAQSLGIQDVVQVDNAQAGMDLVAAGRADAFAMTAISLNWMADNNPGAGVETTEAFVQVIDGVPQIGAGATVFRHENVDLLNAYNTELEKITSDVNAYMGLVGEYGFTEENLPPADLTTEQLCSGDLSDLG